MIAELDKQQKSCEIPRARFDLFKNAVCHELKELSDINFIIKHLEQDTIHQYYERKWYPECLYLLTMIDYLSRINCIPLCNRYNYLRKTKLKQVVYPSSILAAACVSKNGEQIKKDARTASILEFMRFNIVENDIRNVI